MQEPEKICKNCGCECHCKEVECQTCPNDVCSNCQCEETQD
jgi:hypothetical protein